MTKLEKALKKARLEGNEALIAELEARVRAQDVNYEESQDTEDEDEDTIDETEEQETEIDWKEAAKKLKRATETITDSLDDYFVKVEITDCRKRYNEKERTQELYNKINQYCAE